MTRKIEPANTHMVLDPTYAREVVGRHLQPHLDAAREVVAYGADLLLRCFFSMDRTIGNVMVVGVLFRQAVAALDAFVLCLENGAVDAAEVHSRGALEASLSIDWVLKQGKEAWGRRIWIYSLRQNLQWARKLIPGRPEYDGYMAGRAEMGVPARNPNDEELKKHLEAEAEILEKLSEDEFREMNAEFEAYAQKRGHEADWFRPGKDGVSSVYKIAEKLGRLNEYDTFYRSLSYSVHGSHAIKSLIFEPGRIGVEPIRDFEGFATTFGIGINTALSVYATMFGEYRPDERKGFSRKYLDEWRGRLRDLPEIEIEPEQVRL